MRLSICLTRGPRQLAVRADPLGHRCDILCLAGDTYCHCLREACFVHVGGLGGLPDGLHQVGVGLRHRGPTRCSRWRRRRAGHVVRPGGACRKCRDKDQHQGKSSHRHQTPSMCWPRHCTVAWRRGGPAIKWTHQRCRPGGRWEPPDRRFGNSWTFWVWHLVSLRASNG